MPIETVREFLEMCDATRRTMPAGDVAHSDEWGARLTHTLEETYGLDLTDPSVVTAVAAGVVEGMSAAMDHDSVTRGALALGWALYDLAVPHFAASVQS